MIIIFIKTNELMSTVYVYEEWHPHFDVGIYIEKEPLQGEELPDECEVPVRHMSRWTNGEIDTLWNEFQIKRLLIQDIASQHQRTCASILYKLKSEGLLDWSCPLNCETITDIIDKANELITNADYEDEDEDELEDEDEEYVPVLSEDEEEEDEEEEDEEEDDTKDYNVRRVVFENYKPDMMDYVLYAYVDGFHYAVMGMVWTLNMFIEFLKCATDSNKL
jgi:hypothetical protein